jgi:hypothetical protein
MLLSEMDKSVVNYEFKILIFSTLLHCIWTWILIELHKEV